MKKEEKKTETAKLPKQRRRKKRKFKDCMNDVLSLPIKRKEDIERLSQMGMRKKNMDNRTLLAAAMFEKAVESGNVTAFKEICDLVGESENADESGGLEKLISGLKEE